MKKLVLSIFVIAIFAAYTLYLSSSKNISTPPPVVETKQTDLSGSSASIEPPPQSSGTPAPVAIPHVRKVGYKNGEYTGKVADAFYGNFQVAVVIKNGKLADVKFLMYPNDRRTSIEINTSAMLIWKSEAIQAQNAQVDIVSGATQSSGAFQESLASALMMAKN